MSATFGVLVFCNLGIICQGGSAEGYIEIRCNTKAQTLQECNKWTSCKWNAGGNRCSAASATERDAVLKCSSTKMSTGNTCECKKAKDIATMPMAGSKYNYTVGNKSWLLADHWGGSCNSWEADESSKGFHST